MRHWCVYLDDKRKRNTDMMDRTVNAWKNINNRFKPKEKVCQSFYEQEFTK